MASNRSCLLAIAAAGLITYGAAPLLAHHSFVAEFDGKKQLTIVGKVTKIDWTNPHAFIYVDVADPQGTTANWGVELGPPNALLRAGWKRSAVSIGDQLTVNGYASKDGSKRLNARAVQLSDGRNIFAGSVSDTDSPK